MNRPMVAALIALSALAGGASPGQGSPDVTVLGALCAAVPEVPDADDGYLIRLCRNHGTARAAVAIARSGIADDLARGIAHVEVATDWLGEALEVEVKASPPPDHAHPSQAILAVVAAAPTTPPPDLEERAAAYDALPEPARGALTRFLDAFLGLHEASPHGYGAVFPARAALLATVAELRDALAHLPAEDIPPALVVPRGIILDLGDAPSHHADDALVLLDAGGDDVYVDNAGGNGFACPECPNEAEPVPAAVSVDLGGDDHYGTLRGFGQNGGAMQGVGVLVDVGGDDAYVTLHFGTNGAACLGSGLLLDTSGNDRYEAGGYYVNGGGEGGAGLLVDVAGSDAYLATGDSANGGASIQGAGFLLDAAGDDVYQAVSWGANGGARFDGQGFLLDLAGDDHYTAQAEGANGAGTLEPGQDPLLQPLDSGSFGFLYDAGGLDVYFDTEAFNGSGVDRTVLPKGAGAQIDEPPLGLVG